MMEEQTASVGGATSASYTTAGTTYATDNADQYRCELDAVDATAAGIYECSNSDCTKNILYYRTTI